MYKGSSRYLPIGKMFMPFDFLRRTCSIFMSARRLPSARNAFDSSQLKYELGGNAALVATVLTRLHKHSTPPNLRCFAQAPALCLSLLRPTSSSTPGRSQWERLIVVAVSSCMLSVVSLSSLIGTWWLS